MKKLLLVLFLFIAGVNQSHAQNFNLTLLGNRIYPGDALSNIGGWVAPNGIEYALVGTEAGLSIVDVSTPSNPVEVQLVSGPRSIWREVKTYLNYAYVTTEGGNGLQIIDLSQLPSAAPAILWTGNNAIAGQLDNIHSLHIEDGYLYLHGASNISNGATLICDIATNPLSPDYLGVTPGQYVHDGFAKGNRYYGCHIYNGDFTIYDITNKSNPVTLGIQTTPTAFTHNCWTDSSGDYLFTTDENSGSFLASYDVSNPANITELDRIQITPGSGSIVHNTHVVQKSGGEFAVSSWYKDGVVITDVTRPQNMVNVGWYDTYTQGSGDGFNGDWGVYPFLPSGNLLISDIDNGFMILAPSYVRACYLEGVVTDSTTGIPLTNATVQLVGTGISKITPISGLYKTGFHTAGLYDVIVSRPGYMTKTINGVALTNSVVTTLDVQLIPLGQAVSLTGTVIELGTNAPLANTTVTFASTNFDYIVSTDASGNFTVPGFFLDSYDIVAGHWGHRTQCFNTMITGSSSPISIILAKGYYDDFSLDFGWSHTASANDWERAIPVGTISNQGQIANPDTDVQNDCLGLAYVTNNGGGGPADNDVDPTDGVVTLTSPFFDVTSYVNPQLQYYRWFFDGALNGNAPNDNMVVRLQNGSTGVILENIVPSTPNNGSWEAKSWNMASLLPLTSTMQLVIEITDLTPGSIVEGGLDKFEITESVGIDNLATSSQQSLKVSPTLFTDHVTITYAQEKAAVTEISLTDITGKVVETKVVGDKSGTIIAGKTLADGVYLVTMKQGASILKTVKIAKSR